MSEPAPQGWDMVRLTRHELEVAAYVGLRRAVNATWKASAPRGGDQRLSVWQAHIEGAMGELAVARFLHAYWPASFDTFQSVDDLQGWEVRTTRRADGCLIVRGSDSPRPGLRHVLVTLSAEPGPPQLWIRGWLESAEARQPQWQVDPEPRPVWFVPAEALHPFHRLP